MFDLRGPKGEEGRGERWMLVWLLEEVERRWRSMGRRRGGAECVEMAKFKV